MKGSVMKLNADILLERLSRSYKTAIFGRHREDLCLGRPLLYEGREGSFEANSLSVVRAGRLPRYAHANRDAVIVCIGESPKLTRYQECCCVIQVVDDADPYAVFNCLQQTFDAYDAWEDELDRIINDDADIMRMLTASETLVHRNLLAINAEFRVVGVSAHNVLFATPDPSVPGRARDLDLTTFDQFLSLHDLSMEEQEPFILDLLDQPSLNYNLYDHGEYQGCVTIQYDERGFHAEDKPLLTILGSKLVRALRQHGEYDNAHGSLQQAIQDLVNGYPIDPVGRAAFEKAASERSFVCMRLKLSNRLANLPLGYVRNMLESAFPRSVTFEHHKNSVVAFIDLTELDESLPYQEAISRRIEPFSTTMGLRAGISDPVRDIMDARLYYLEANIALENGALFGESKVLSEFQDYVLEDMVVNSMGELPLDLLLPSGLRSLIEHDGASSTSYVETLSCFLDNNQNITKTAADLYVHRSTLLERLRRIRRDLGLDLDDPAVVLRLRLLLEAMRIRERMAG